MGTRLTFQFVFTTQVLLQYCDIIAVNILVIVAIIIVVIVIVVSNSSATEGRKNSVLSIFTPPSSNLSRTPRLSLSDFPVII